jgi:Uncharacterized conserved protein
MINQVTMARVEALRSQYQELAERHPEAPAEIALAEVPEAVHQSNAIENSTLTLEDTERIISGSLPAASHELREVFEASNLARVTTDLLRSMEPLTTELILRWHGELLTGSATTPRAGSAGTASGCASAPTWGRTRRSFLNSSIERWSAIEAARPTASWSASHGSTASSR